MSLILPNRFMQQPQQAAQPDWGNPITRGLVDLVSPGLSLWDAVKSDSFILHGTNVPIVSKFGRGIATDGASNYWTRARAPLTNLSEFSAMALLSPTNIVNTVLGALSIGNQSNDQPFFSLGQWNTASALAVFVRGDNSTSEETTGASAEWANGKPALVIFTRSEIANVSRLYCNGSLVVSGPATALGVATLTKTAVGALGRNGDGFFWAGQYSGHAVWNRPLSINEAVSLSASPWQVYKATARKLWVSAVAPPPAGSTGAAMYHHLQMIGAY